MSDDIERATRDHAVVLESLIKVRRDVPNIRHTGKCHYCEAKVDPPKLYCSGDCATDHDKEMNKFR